MSEREREGRHHCCAVRHESGRGLREAGSEVGREDESWQNGVSDETEIDQ